MKTVHVLIKERPYPIYIGDLSDSVLVKLLEKRNLIQKPILLTHRKLYNLYGKKIINNLKRKGSLPKTFCIPEGETAKSWYQAGRLYQEFLMAKVDRGSCVIILGGGVLGDLGGFVAATYKRGIPMIQVPTSLLAQVDSSIGGKVAVDHKMGKNMIGCFYHPRFVFSSLKFLKTLPMKEIRNGLAEVIKCGMIADAELFSYIEKNFKEILNLNNRALEHIIWKASMLKAKIVALDEKEEKGIRHFLNFGHTVGHALETAGQYQGLSHGEAVSLGMVFATKLSLELGLCSSEVLCRLVDILERVGLPTVARKMPVEKVERALLLDKKVQNSQISLILTRKIGHVILFRNPAQQVFHKVLNEFLS